MKKIILTEEEKKEIEDVQKRLQNMRYMFHEASERLGDAQREFWEKLLVMYPTAKKIDTPMNSDWVVYCGEKAIQEDFE